MSVPVKLYIRGRLPDGSYPYLKPAYSARGRLLPSQGIRDGQRITIPDASYYLRYTRGDKRIWESVGPEPGLALACLQRRTLTIQMGEMEDSVLDAVPIPAPLPPPVNVAEPPPTPDKRLLSDCISLYMDEVREHRSHKTYAAYSTTLRSFAQAIPREFIEDIAREDVLAYVAWLRKRGNAPRTMRNRVDFLHVFLHRFDIPTLLRKKDRPQFTRKQVRAYSPSDIDKMFDVASEDEADFLFFLLCTGAREQEAQYCCWTDIDLENKTYTVTEHRDLGFRPKDKEEGTLPIPSILVDRLVARRERMPRVRLVFPSLSGKPNGHALRMVKRIALRAGINCGNCMNKRGQSCIEYPVCKHIFLHKMRKTFASTLHQNGLPAQTLQRYLRHSDLKTTIAYIADQPDEQIRETIESTFSGFGGGAR